MNGIFVTGTDTDVGKTCVGAGLLLWLRDAGVLSAGFKPVAAGMQAVGGRLVNDDVAALRAASGLALSDAEVGPLQFQTACAPHIAAALEGRQIDRALLGRAAHALAVRCDFLLVEGAGGFCVPLGSDWDSGDLARDLGLPMLLVVGLRLGCLNHALLTAEAIAARGLSLAGWVANLADPAMPHCGENVATLRHELQRRHGAACLGVVPRLAVPSAAAVAAHLDGPALRTALSL